MSGCFFLKHGVLITDRKSHMSFRLVPNSVTLDDLERCLGVQACFRQAPY